jgi:hypothetical protein
MSCFSSWCSGEVMAFRIPELLGPKIPCFVDERSTIGYISVKQLRNRTKLTGGALRHNAEFHAEQSELPSTDCHVLKNLLSGACG